MTTAWSTVDVVRQRLRRLWDNGRVLSQLVVDDGLFPLRIPLKGPSSAELGTRFDDARRWIAAVHAWPHVEIESREINHRQLGSNRVPVAAVVSSPNVAAAVLGTRRDVEQFSALVAHTGERRPELSGVLARRSLDVLAAADDWPRLLAVIDWLDANPRPGVYVRQADAPGVHTKLIERHRKLLGHLLDAALPPSAIDTAWGHGDFERRYGFRVRPRLVRFRFLGREQPAGHPGWVSERDLTVTAADFARLDPPARVFVTENEVNFLAFPEVDDSIVVFGAGSGFEHLAIAGWLQDVPVHYWGDIDTHGFALLDQFRTTVPSASSLLMDMETLTSHQEFWGHESSPVIRDLARLTVDERMVYDTLRDNRLRPGLRLEQERIRFGRVRRAVEAACGVM